MFVATKDRALATTITGSLPRPSWYRENLNGRRFSRAMTDFRFREEYCDTVAAMLCEQAAAGLDILVDGDARFDADIGGRSWMAYVYERLTGIAEGSVVEGPEALKAPRGHILQRVQETFVPGRVTGHVRRDCPDFANVWRTAQQFSQRPVKFGTCCGQLISSILVDEFYHDSRALAGDVADAMNAEYHELADAGCPLIQLEEPVVHIVDPKALGAEAAFYIDNFNREVHGLREKTEVWVHTCWGNPLAQKVGTHFDYTRSLPLLTQLDVDAITFETASDNGAALEEIARGVPRRMKVVIGVINHRSLEIETSEKVANLIRTALRFIPPERLVISTDCGFGRHGMSRMHAYFKMVALRLGTNIVRKELGLEEMPCLAAEQSFTLQ
jgi:5-methyltetrahydropteroyltriglutamate--homocysteine methyltransferase